MEHTLNNYQNEAMVTCMPSCKNITYMLLNLCGEVGELEGKIAKCVRKGWMRIDDNDLRWNVQDIAAAENIQNEIVGEIGDCLWQLAGVAKVLGYPLEFVAEHNLDKLARRAAAGTIDGRGDGIAGEGRKTDII